jgi:hypothetical protein
VGISSSFRTQPRLVAKLTGEMGRHVEGEDSSKIFTSPEIAFPRNGNAEAKSRRAAMMLIKEGIEIMPFRYRVRVPG